jgi:site-specific DNA-methyltransferase (adenine-specific)
MKDIPDKSIDMVLTDPPYGTTACKWDTVIPFEPLWEQYERIIKHNGAIVLTATQPFTSKLVMSNIEWFKYQWVWDKGKCSGFLNAKNAPMKRHEDVLIFSNGTIANKSQRLMVYNPQGLVECSIARRDTNRKIDSTTGSRPSRTGTWEQKYTNYPTSILDITFETKPVHPTQKPVALMEYLIKSYTNEGETVLDNTMGSGTTGVACVNTGRKFIGIEKDDKYFEIASNRIQEALKEKSLNVFE